MYAIIKTGGKQYSVREGDIIDVELINSLSEDSGKEVKFDDVLFVSNENEVSIGQPSISEFFVFGEHLGTVSGEKVTSLKYKPSHTQCRKWGHRQKYSRVKITRIGKK